MRNNGERVIAAQLNARGCKFIGFGRPWRMDDFVGESGQLWQVTSDEFTFWVELGALAHWVEDSEIRLCVAAA